jgi:transcriptional regulator with XRE-family HTH domain
MILNTIGATEQASNLIGTVVRALRVARGLSVNQLGIAAGLEPANLSRFERGIPGGVHASKHLHLIATRLGTRASVLYAIAEMASIDPEILQHPKNVPEITHELTERLNRYINDKLNSISS